MMKTFKKDQSMVLSKNYYPTEIFESCFEFFIFILKNNLEIAYLQIILLILSNYTFLSKVLHNLW